MVHANNQLIKILKARGPEAAIDMDNAASRVTLDVIGRVGFDKDFHATQNLNDAVTNRAFDLMTAGKNSGLVFMPIASHTLISMHTSGILRRYREAAYYFITRRGRY